MSIAHLGVVGVVKTAFQSDVWRISKQKAVRQFYTIACLLNICNRLKTHREVKTDHVLLFQLHHSSLFPIKAALTWEEKQGWNS